MVDSVADEDEAMSEPAPSAFPQGFLRRAYEATYPEVQRALGERVSFVFDASLEIQALVDGPPDDDEDDV
jgi:hypothetical protein